MNHDDLKLILDSKVSLVVIETYDELRALSSLRVFFKQRKMPVWRWSITEGLNALGLGLQMESAQDYADPEKMLRHIKSHTPASAFVLCDLHPFLDEPKIVRLLKEIALNQQQAAHKLVLLSHSLKLPDELVRFAASLALSLPDEEEILAIVKEEARDWAKRHDKSRIKTDNVTLQKLINNLLGLPHNDVRRLARGAIADDGAITESDIPKIAKAKLELMNMEGVLHYEYNTAHMQEVAGLHNLKHWLDTRKQVMLANQDGDVSLDKPKGVLLCGVQGGGKSLAAKAIAGMWGLPLLRLDMATLFDKYVGETERNLREALKLADLMSPCVLWLDELEKGMAHGTEDSGMPRRLLGTLLTWMAERDSAVFIAATSNDISQLPPELLRKGRFDEIFFVDLPDVVMREAIAAIHLNKRDYDSSHFDLKYLAELAEGFTGAEIEQAIVSAIYTALARQQTLNTDLVAGAIRQTQPLSVVMAERVASLRAWAKDRAVLAN